MSLISLFRTQAALLPLKLLLVIACTALRAQTVHTDPFVELDKYKMEHVRQLVDLAGTYDYFGEPLTKAEIAAMVKAEEEKERRRLHALQTEPGLGPYLVALAGRSLVKKSSSYYLIPVFEAMSLRKDTDPAVVRHYIQLAKSHLDSAPQKMSLHEDCLLRGVCYFLQLHATPENESLLIRMMKLGEKQDNLWLILSAADALSKTGTATHALPAMDAALRWIQLRREKGEPLAPGEKQMTDCIKRLHSRISGTSPQSV